MTTLGGCQNIMNCDKVRNIKHTQLTYTSVDSLSVECRSMRTQKLASTTIRTFHTLDSPGMIVNVTFPVVLLINWMTSFCDIPSTGMPLMLRISSPGRSRPSSSVILLGATLLMYTGLSPLDELAPPTMLNPRLSFPSRTMVMVYSCGLMEGKEVIC